MTNDRDGETRKQAPASEGVGDPRPDAALRVVDGEDGLFLVADEAGEGERWRAEEVRGLKISDGPEGPRVELRLFEGGRRCVPVPSSAKARKVLREFAAAVNGRLGRPEDPLAARISRAFRGAEGGPHGTG